MTNPHTPPPPNSPTNRPSSSALSRYFFPVPEGTPPLQPFERRAVMRLWWDRSLLYRVPLMIALTFIVGFVMLVLLTPTFSPRSGVLRPLFVRWVDLLEWLGLTGYAPLHVTAFVLGLIHVPFTVRLRNRGIIAACDRTLIDRTTTCAHCGYPLPIQPTITPSTIPTLPICPECGTEALPDSRFSKPTGPRYDPMKHLVRPNYQPTSPPPPTTQPPPSQEEGGQV